MKQGGVVELGAFVLALAGSLAVTWYAHGVQGQETLFTHLYYLPIVLAAFRWGSLALPVPVLLTANLIISHHFTALPNPLSHDLVRGLMFIIVGAVLGYSVDSRKRLQQEALEEHHRNIQQMNEHFDYMERVAHELRNPLQVSLGVLDSLDLRQLPAEQKTLLDALNRCTDEMTVRIKGLTPDGRG